VNTEYGIFTEEGCIEADFYDHADAEAAAELYRAQAEEEEVEETYTVKEMCADHRDAEMPRGECDECDEEGEE
jgi:Ni2+-binding GTPase involved in maturation of urease and hydrogenase